jgi:SpoVK/Ycf46/Vps4 family AAA+-type ATPase
MSDSTFIGFLLSNKNAIYIIEDAEKLIESRKSYTSSNVLSSFLNLSDGLTANAIKSKFICTFNENVSNIDAAVMRKGRLKLKFEFKKLCVEKAQRINPEVTAPISLADLFNMQENDFTKKPVRQIGFH